ncbi:MAG: YIP1 family protein [Marinifilaceae bacterium]|jgi:hypothetical protein
MKIHSINLTHVFHRTRSIILNPKAEWDIIAQKEQNKKELYLNYALPLISICSLLAFSGILINYSDLTHALSQMLIVFLSLSGGLFLAATIIKELAPNFNGSKNENRNFMLVIYAASIFCIFHSAANMFSLFSFFRQLFLLVELYFIRLFWLGISPLLQMPENKKAGFTLISALIILIIPLILERMLSILFNVPIVSI